MKTDIRQDFIECQNLLKDLGFESSGSDIGFRWYFDKLEILIAPKSHPSYDENDGYIMLPHILLSFRYDDGEIIDVLVSQNYNQIRNTIIGDCISDLGIKELNRNLKLHSILNNVEFKENDPHTISCLALKLNPKLLLSRFS